MEREDRAGHRDEHAEDHEDQDTVAHRRSRLLGLCPADGSVVPELESEVGGQTVRGCGIAVHLVLARCAGDRGVPALPHEIDELGAHLRAAVNVRDRADQVRQRWRSWRRAAVRGPQRNESDRACQDEEHQAYDDCPPAGIPVSIHVAAPNDQPRDTVAAA